MGSIEMRPWIVQKYGRTSVGKPLDTITGTIVQDYLQRFQVAVVCSARSGTKKTNGTTSLLLEAIRLATSLDTSATDLNEIIGIVKREHLAAARSIAAGSEQRETSRLVLDQLRGGIDNDCEHLRSFLKATWTLGEMSERTQDRVLAVGETLACRLVVASLKLKVCSL
jgi:aspartate kinase